MDRDSAQHGAASRDEALSRRLSATPNELRTRLHAAVASLQTADAEGRPAFRWTEPQGDGSPTHPRLLPYPVYSTEVQDLIAVIERVGARAGVRGMNMRDPAAYLNESPPHIASAAESLRLLVTIIYGERFTDGVVAAALRNGVLLAASEYHAAELPVVQ